jgi:hypothetical protein
VLNWGEEIEVHKIAAQFRLSEWAEMVKEKMTSGQSVKTFCESLGISENTYYIRQRKVRIAACTAHEEKQRKNEMSSVPSGWAVAEIVSTTGENGSLVVEINGCKIEVTQSTDADLLAKTCRVLKSLC